MTEKVTILTSDKNYHSYITDRWTADGSWIAIQTSDTVRVLLPSHRVISVTVEEIEL
jgi:Tol biopolymer transport system component